MDALIDAVAMHKGWVAVFLVGVGLLLIFKRNGSAKTKPTAAPNIRTKTSDRMSGIPPGVRVAPQPLLTDAEAALYNLMRIAVQEEFLIFAQVPIWCLVDIKADDQHERHALLKEIAFRRIQFVLVHPGTLQVSKIVEIDDQKDTSPQKEARDRLLDDIFGRAKIPMIRLDKDMEYSVAVLAGLLGVEPAPLDDP